MKYLLALFILFSNSSIAQWQAGVMAGVSGYNGDLSKHTISSKTMGPAIGIEVKYILPNKYLVIRGGLTYGKIGANDKYSDNPVLKGRNLNFKTNLLEGSVGAEFNLADPEYFTAYPYLFGAVGIFHYDPYTFDNSGKKTFLRSLGTEGQGLEKYPGRNMYTLTQFCLPMGIGWKWAVSEKYQLVYEVGARYLLTDYLDDVSTTYADPQILQAERGRIAAELAYRGNTIVGPIEGRQRGNSKKNDWYYMMGFKLVVNLNNK